jgi:hypothetical protein
MGSMLLAVFLVAGSSGEIPVEIRNTSGARLADIPVTFGQAFPRGAVGKDQEVQIVPADMTAQVDRKRHHEDGSLRFAVVSVKVPDLPAGGALKLTLRGGPRTPRPAAKLVAAGDLLAAGFDAAVTLRFPDGAMRSISARKLLEAAGDRAVTWLRGEVATEWLLAGPPVDANGKPDEDLEVRFQVRAYAGGKRARVSVAVESCSDGWAGNIRYDAAVTAGGKEVFSARAVDHRPLARWRKVFWWGEPADGVHIVHDLATLSAAGALPNYDRTLRPAEPGAEYRKGLDLQGPDWRIMGRGSLVAYMGTTGGRMEIAPYPTWTVRYLLTLDPWEEAVVLAHGDLAGSWPIHVRARRTGRIMTIDERPQFWLDERGKDRPEWKPARHEPDPKGDRLDPDLAHQPSLAYVPYLLTGDSHYLEEAYFWANFCLLRMWPEPREGARGILADQIRGDAWALRNIADAEWIATDGDPEAAYFREKIRNNLAARISRMYGPPEYNGLGAWGVRTVEDARIQNAPNPDWLITVPWEEDYLLWSFHHLVELGHAEAARPRDFLLRLRVGLLTHAPDYDPMLATPYRLVVGERAPGGREVFYEDWKVLGRENARLSKPDLPNYGNSYAYSARAAAICGIDGGFPRAREALEWLDAHLPDHRRMLGENPVWAIVPRVAAR